MKYYIVDAFTSEPFGGNPAGVVLLDRDFLADELMRLVTAELRYSETAFVQQNGAAEFTVRYFTPKGEVDLCGHATIATFGVLCQMGILRDGDVCMNHTLAGDLEVRIGEQVMMQMAMPRVIDKRVDTERLHGIMVGTTMPGWPDIPIEIVSTGLPDIMMPVATVDELNAMQPDMDALSELSRELEVTGVHAFALSEDGYTAHVRNFGPLYGIPEESATGTANAALTHYLYRRGLIAVPSACRFLQGETMGRPSVVATMLEDDGTIWVGGKSRILAQGNLMCID
jgi:PhzF family phenazine biosynthesis protein